MDIRSYSRREMCALGACCAASCLITGAKTGLAADAEIELDSSYKFYCPDIVEIVEPGPLVRADGTARCGWSRRPLLDLNLEDARFMAIPHFQRYRLKKWDMYHVYTPEIVLNLLTAWIGYAAFCWVYVYDRTTQQSMENMHIRPPRPALKMMRNSNTGITEYHSSKINAVYETDGERYKLRAESREFADVGLKTEIDLRHPPGHESICGVHMTEPKRMHYGRKINAMPASGWVSVGDKKYDLEPETSFGALDFGRGYYPPRLFWYWATASGMQHGKLTGFNLGHGNNPNEVTENAVFYDGKLHKMGSLDVLCDKNNPMKPWHIKSRDGRLDISFSPEKARCNKLNLGFLYTRGCPTFGYFSGTVILDSGENLVIENIFGLFEWVDQKW